MNRPYFALAVLSCIVAFIVTLLATGYHTIYAQSLADTIQSSAGLTVVPESSQFGSPQPDVQKQPVDILKNGGFEISADSGEDPMHNFEWKLGGVTVVTVSDDKGQFIVSENGFPDPLPSSILGFAPHSGKYALLFGDIDPAQYISNFVRYQIKQNRAWQYLSIPNGKSATLRFMYRIISKQACGKDYAQVVVRELMGAPETLATFEICQANDSKEWKKVEVDLSAYMGKTLFVQLEGAIHDTAETSAWVVDTAELVVTFLPNQVTPTAHHLYFPALNRAESIVPFALTCKPSQGVGGFLPGHIYKTEVAGLPGYVAVGKQYDPGNATFLAFYMHGDDGGYANIYANSEIRDLIDDEGWVSVSVQAPNFYGEPYISWKEGDFERKAKMLTAVFDEMFAHYNLCQGVLFGAGASGGSVAFTRAFEPLFGDRYPTYFFANCGGSYPPDSILSSTDIDDLLQLYGQTPEIAGRLGVTFQYSSDDFVAHEVEIAIAGYRKNNIQTEVIKTNSSGHCGSENAEPASEYWRTIAKRVVR